MLAARNRLTQHTLTQTNKSTSGILMFLPSPLQNGGWGGGGHSFAIPGNEPSIQLLWSMPPVANLGVPALLAAQLQLKWGGMPSQTTPTPKFKVVSSHSLNIQMYMWEKAHSSNYTLVCTKSNTDAHVNLCTCTHTHTADPSSSFYGLFSTSAGIELC